MHKQKILSTIHWFCFLGILLLSIYSRFWDVGVNPAWYTDEATHVEIAHNLIEGEIRYFAIQDSWLLFARLPLFEYALAGVFRIFGVGIAVLRGFTGFFGVITIVLLYFALRHISGNRWFGLVCCAAFALLPQAILYNRFGFSYNLLLPLIVLILWGFYNYRVTSKRCFLLLSTIYIGFGCVSDVIMWSFLPTIFFIVWHVRWQDALWSLLLAITPFSIYAFYNLVNIPDTFLFDLGYTLRRTSGGSIFEQISLITENYMIMLGDWEWIIGMVGLVTLSDKQLRYVLFVMFLPLLLVARTVPLYSLSAYYILPFLPLVAVGIGAFLVNLWMYAKDHIDSKVGRLLIAGLIAIPIIVSGYQTHKQINTRFTTAIDAFLINPEYAQMVADYVNRHTDDDDLVISSAPIGWLIEAHVADFQMAAIADGLDAIHLPGNLLQSRFAFSVNYQQAKYVIIDDLWRNWSAVHIPQIASMVDEVQNWELVFEVGTIHVYER